MKYIYTCFYYFFYLYLLFFTLDYPMVVSYKSIDLKSISNFEMIFKEMIIIENSKYYETKYEIPPSFRVYK